MKFDTKIIMLFNEFRKLDADMTIHQAVCFMYVVKYNGITMKELADRIGIAQSSTSRNVAALSKWHRLGKEGLDLVEAIEDPAERRKKRVSLTPKGKLMAEQLRSIVEEG